MDQWALTALKACVSWISLEHALRWLQLVYKSIRPIQFGIIRAPKTPHWSMGFPVSGNWTDLRSLITGQMRLYMSYTPSSCCSKMVTGYNWFTNLLALLEVKELTNQVTGSWDFRLVSGNWMDQWSSTSNQMRVHTNCISLCGCEQSWK